MAKQAKIPQTEWTRGGRDISNTAIPLYQSNLQRMDEFLQDPTARMDMYMDKYYGPNSVDTQDLIRAYNRAMGNATGQNYSATAGGYTSSGQRAYKDQQMFYNDLIARLQGRNTMNAYNMGAQDFSNMRGANADYLNAYGLGKSYSQIEQQNSLADQANRNWLGQGLSGVGKVLSAIPTPVTQGLGAAMQLGGNLATTDTSQAMAAIYGGSPSSYDTGNVYGDAFTNIGKMDWTPTVEWWNNRGSSTAKGTGATQANGLPLWAK